MWFLLTENLCNVIDNMPNLEKTLSMDCIMALVYISGYIMRNDSITEDSHFYFEKYCKFLNEMNRGGLTVPGDSMCQWVIFCYIVFHEVNEKTCRTSLSNIFMIIAEMYNQNKTRTHARILSNILFNNSKSDKEPKQNVLKLSQSNISSI